MADETHKRRLAAILAADVVGLRYPRNSGIRHGIRCFGFSLAVVDR